MAFEPDKYDEDYFKSLLNSNLIYSRDDIQLYSKFSRFGYLDPYNRLGPTREYLFFVKPDLHIWEPGTIDLNGQLSSYTFFYELNQNYPYVIQMLQKSAGTYGDSKSAKTPFIPILTNSVRSTLDLDDLTADEMESASTMYGSKILYRKHTFSQDENVDFTLEFEDTKYLEIYNLVKAYDQYNRLAQFGIVDPPNIDKQVNSGGWNYNSYVKNRELHDAMGIYKIIVDGDYETIIYAAYLCGVYIKNVPRSSFSDITSSGDPLKYTISFHAFSVEDQDPAILVDFNNLISTAYDTNGEAPGEELPIYDTDMDRINGEWATCPWIVRTYKKNVSDSAWLGSKGMRYKYKLKWRAI